MEDGPPRFPQDFSCPAVLRYPLRVRSVFAYRAITFYGSAFQRNSTNSRIGNSTHVGPTTPSVARDAQRRFTLHRAARLCAACNAGFRLFRFRSPLLPESRLMSFPPGTEMVHFPGLTRARLWIQRAVCRVYRHGFPHSEIPGSKPACGSPRLIGACPVLRRLLAPRHPPHALSSLTIKLTECVPNDRDATPARRSLPSRIFSSRDDLRTCGYPATKKWAGHCQPDSVVKEQKTRR